MGVCKHCGEGEAGHGPNFEPSEEREVKMKASVMIGGKSDTFDRKDGDFYPTPENVTQALINFEIIPRSSLIWEPACGDGAMVKVFEENGFTCASTDISKGDDFLKYDAAFPIEAIITNPPFNLSQKFIERCMELKSPIFCMLLKSQYWHSKKRAKLFKDYAPSYILALTWRPDFLSGERGGSPTMDMLWTVWLQNDRDTKYRLLEKPEKIQKGVCPRCSHWLIAEDCRMICVGCGFKWA